MKRSAGYYHYICHIVARPNDEDEYEDFGHFDLHLSLFQQELEKKEPKREPYLETSFFAEDWIEINFRFKTSYRDSETDIRLYLEMVQEDMENHLNITIIDFQIEDII